MSPPGPLVPGAEAPILDAENPWPGLAPFAEDQAAFFYGRRKEVEDLFRLVRLNALTVLYGQSGLGKTSLLSAALFPRLRSAGYLPVPIRLHYSAAAPGPRAQLWQALAAAFEAGGLSAPHLGDDETLWEYFHRRSLALQDRSGNALKPVLIFDQFEELFTLGAEHADGGGFVRDSVAELAALIENHPPDRVEARFDREPSLVGQFDFDRQDHQVLLSLREDYLAHLHDLAPRIPSITLNNMRLTPLDGPRALDAVEKPGGALVTPEVAAAIVRFVAGAAVERKSGDGAAGVEPRAAAELRPIESLVVDPSLLSLSCRELNQKRRAAGERRITPALVAETSENILNEFYERSLADLPDAARIFVEDELLTPSGFRETKALETARSELAAAGAPAGVLDTLVARRLLHYELRGRDTRVELTHDVLTKVVSASRDRRRAVEAEHEEKLRLQEAESRARAAQEEARRELEETQARQRKLRVLAGALGVVAVLAAVQSWRASQAKGAAVTNAERADSAASISRSMSDTLRRKSDSLVRVLTHDSAQQVALRDTTLKAKEARRLAESLRQGSDSMLKDFCTDQLRTINRFDFGEATKARADLVRTYIGLLETADSSIEDMLKRKADDPCPRLLDARVESVLPALLMQRGQPARREQPSDTALARTRGRSGIAAAVRLARFGDPLSRQWATRSLYTLTYDLHFAGDDSASLAAGRAALPLADSVDARRDSLAFNRRARIYFYGGASLLRSKRPTEGRAWLDTGLVVARQGHARADQNQWELSYTESQLHLYRAYADSALHDTVGALAESRAAVDAAREQQARRQAAPSLNWLASMHGWRGDLARALNRSDEAYHAYDSAAAQWGNLITMGRSKADTGLVASGLAGLMGTLSYRGAILIQSNRWEEAVHFIPALVDSAMALDQIRPTVDVKRWQDMVPLLGLLGDTLRIRGRFALADTAYRTALRVDSTLYVRNPKSGAAQDLLLRFSRINRVLLQRQTADTAGRDSATAARILRGYEEIRRRDATTRVWYWRSQLASLRADSTRDSLAAQLGNLSWYDLLTGRAEEAVLLAEEGRFLSKKQTFILPNLFNALVLSALDEEAVGFFNGHARERVEDDPVPFPCAVQRDIRELRWRGVALDRHVQLVERLAAPYVASCQKPKSPGTP